MMIRTSSLSVDILYAASLAEVRAEVEHKRTTHTGLHWYRVKLFPLGEIWRRYSPSGRRVNAVCWHGHRDFFRALFTIDDDTKIVSCLATWNGSAHFEATYRNTYVGRNGIVNCGPWGGVPYGSLCECSMWDA